jgi:predicted RNase H-like HicB family nuclease
MKGYAVIVEGEEGAYSAYSPDLPGCVATGRTLDEVVQEMREAIEFHLEGLRLEGQPIPSPSTVAATVIQASAA